MYYVDVYLIIFTYGLPIDHNFNSCLSPLSVLRLALNDIGHNAISDRSNRQKRHHEPDAIDENYYDDEHSHPETTVKITPRMLMEMCPVLLVQLDQVACSNVLRKAVPKTVGFGIGKLG